LALALLATLLLICVVIAARWTMLRYRAYRGKGGSFWSFFSPVGGWVFSGIFDDLLAIFDESLVLTAKVFLVVLFLLVCCAVFGVWRPRVNLGGSSPFFQSFLGLARLLVMGIGDGINGEYNRGVFLGCIATFGVLIVWHVCVEQVNSFNEWYGARVARLAADVKAKEHEEAVRAARESAGPADCAGASRAPLEEVSGLAGGGLDRTAPVFAKAGENNDALHAPSSRGSSGSSASCEAIDLRGVDSIRPIDPLEVDYLAVDGVPSQNIVLFFFVALLIVCVLIAVN
jgi:hypothetical protein